MVTKYGLGDYRCMGKIELEHRGLCCKWQGREWIQGQNVHLSADMALVLLNVEITALLLNMDITSLVSTVDITFIVLNDNDIVENTWIIFNMDITLIMLTVPGF